jgi:predicted phage baseplate assembly protein
MSLPVPNLDDRRFQDLVDDAKRLVQRNCPEWTDHNVSDPGVTLIEAFATMVDQLLYRLNRVPDATYLRFLELIGVRLLPPTAARTDLTFWLSAPRPDPVVIGVDAEIATPRTETEDPVVFGTLADLTIQPCALAHLVTVAGGGEPVERELDAPGGELFPCFAAQPRPGDTVLFGLSEPVPGGIVLLRLDCQVEGAGVDPRDPPLLWEAWTARGWVACEVERDTTGGLNQLGEVVLHLPGIAHGPGRHAREAGHTGSVVAGLRAGWLRCRVVAPEPDQPFYSASPRMRAASAATIGGTVGAMHAQAVRGELLGRSEGVPGQRFSLQHGPVVVGAEPFEVEVSGDDGWRPWRAVETFAYSGPDDRHVMLDPSAGEVRFGPAVREPDGTLRQYGAVPPKGATLRVPVYRTGGGRRGNVAPGLLRVQRDPVPFVGRVENRHRATGGVAGETVAEAVQRGPLVLRTRDRAVTAEDYEQLVREAAPEVARVRCAPAGGANGGDGAEGSARILVVPACPRDDEGRLRFADLRPATPTLERVAAYLDERRCLGARLVVEPPFYQGVTVVARIRARSHRDLNVLTRRAVRALYGYLDPLSGGPDRDGWPFGRPVQAGEVYGVLQALPGVDLVEDVRLFGADPVTGDRGAATARLDLPPAALVFSYDHQVRVTVA